MRALRINKIAAFITCILVAFILTGCWNRREIESLGFVTMVGIDKAREEGKIELTVHIAKPFALGKEGALPVEKPFWVVSSTGYTVFDAVRNLRAQTPREPVWMHARLVILGEQLAREGIWDEVDFFDRDNETYWLLNIMVAKGVKASEMLHSEFEVEKMPARGIFGILLRAEADMSSIVTVTHTELLQAMEAEGVEPVLTRAEITQRRGEDSVEGELTREDIGKSVRITGAAVFKGDRLKGFLNKPETRGLNWIKGDTKSGIIVIEHPQRKGKYVALEMLRAKGSYDVKIVDGKPHVDVRVDAQGNLGDVQEFMDMFENPELWQSMERRMAAVIRNEVMAAVAKAKEYESDIFGFGGYVARNEPKVWEKIKKQWDQMFLECIVNVDVRCELKRAGRVLRSTKIK
jgi:spore germination protein KC